MDFVKSSIGFNESIVVESKGSAGGLCMMWKAGISAHCVEFNKNLIAIRVSDPICDWIIVGFYGPPYPAKKKKSWENLFALLNSFQGPWICLGDFNFIINENESSNKKSGESSAPNYLKELMLEFGAIDLGFSRTHLGAINSDHAPILLETNPEDTFAHRPFRFEAVWIRDDRCATVVEKAWIKEVRGSDFVKLYKKQAGTRDALRKWNKEVFDNCQSRINLLLQKIKDIQSNDDSADNGLSKATLLSELSKWLLRSEILWRQKSRELRLKERDNNSKFFHLSTIIRRRHNHIDAIKGENGNWVTGSNRIREKFLQHFKELYKEEEVSFPDHLDNLIKPCITDDENYDLCCTPTPEEIRLTLFNM
ncbi:uncharacterized protein LOC115949895 [Quercus lobata]|uniref:uncharacterized protein LOC115949895 n=1 Tax=Quercus lobata TaxID=97700 RepID=UPI001246DB33|nr:uncharacterized protein LOC115949895 [Quercus lobata]